jgi:hypothetical protein
LLRRRCGVGGFAWMILVARVRRRIRLLPGGIGRLVAAAGATARAAAAAVVDGAAAGACVGTDVARAGADTATIGVGTRCRTRVWMR